MSSSARPLYLARKREPPPEADNIEEDKETVGCWEPMAPLRKNAVGYDNLCPLFYTELRLDISSRLSNNDLYLYRFGSRA